MKTGLYACASALALGSSLWASRTFFSLPVPFHPASAERQTMNHNQLRDYINEPYNGLSIEFFGGQSIDAESLATYFFPFNKSCLTTGAFGSADVKNNTVDLLVHYFDVLNGENFRGKTDIFPVVATWNFQGHLSICPVHSFWGIGFVYHRQLSERHDKGLWLELALPVMVIKNNMHLCEEISQPTELSATPDKSFFGSGDGLAYQCMTAALRSNNFQYGKIDAREYTQAKWGVADFEAQLGYTYIRAPNYHLSSYFGILAPTGNTPTAEYLFEKVIGYEGHMGFFFGSRGGIAVWHHINNKLSFEVETSQSIFLDNTQVRSFDLYGKPWGRYLWVYPTNDTQAYIAPGINYFTKAVTVSHGSLRNLNLACTYNARNFQGELGYHCYIRGEENVHLIKAWQEGPSIAALWYSNNNFIQNGERRVSRDGATINEYLNIHNDFQDFTSDAYSSATNDTYVPIKESQLDLDSAKHPAIVMHTMYASLGYEWYDCRMPTFINFAGSYNFGYGNAILNHIKCWLKFGSSF
jgi:hypothetical protein